MCKFSTNPQLLTKRKGMSLSPTQIFVAINLIILYRNHVYKISPNSNQAIVLNPNDKDEDFLIITVLDRTGQRPLNEKNPDFTYEIDSSKEHYPLKSKAKDREVSMPVNHNVCSIL